MKKKFYKNKWFIIAVIVFLILIILIFTGERRFYTSFYTDRTITVWNNYVIFEKYDGQLPPKGNYIKLRHKRDGEVCVFFKQDNTVTIWSESRWPIKTKFDKNDYDVHIYYGSDNYNKYSDECKYTDSLAVVEYELKNRHGYLKLMMNEIATDTIRVSHYEINQFNKITRKHRMLLTSDDEHRHCKWDR